MNPLQPLRFSFSGTHLIEASAGTGKTYTIANLYLRLVLGHNCIARDVENILLVTFTNAATAELRERILSRLSVALADFKAGQSQDDFTQTLIEEIVDLKVAIQRLKIATLNMDIAAIYTIHGFCYRTLQEHAFSSGISFQQNLLIEESDYLIMAANDFWRAHVVNAHPLKLGQLLKIWNSPESLTTSVREFLNKSILLPDLKLATKSLEDLSQRYERQILDLKRWWVDNNIAQALSEAELRKNSLVANQEVLNKMQAFCHSAQWEFYRGKGSWDIFSQAKVIKAKTKKSVLSDEFDFSRFDELASLQEAFRQQLENTYLLHAIAFIRAHLRSSKGQDQVLSPDDLLQSFCEALENPASGNTLVQQIRRRYPSAMVDEFQDTDPIQYQIFDLIYRENEEAQAARNAVNLVLIGDPKQAIYGFRGGDIFTYLKAKSQIAESKQLTLADNWRSQESLVKATNDLFASSESGFIYNEDIPFLPVNARKSASIVTLRDSCIAALSFNFLQNEESIKENSPVLFPQSDAMTRMAELCGDSILNVCLDGTVDGERVLNGDICILVRDRREAQLIKDALSRRQLPSVYLTRQSVFESYTAYGIWLLVNGIYDYKNESSIVSALLDPLFNFTASELNELRSNPQAWSNVLNQFQQAHDIWHNKGFAAGLYFLIDCFDLFLRVAKSKEEPERLLTDVRHLIEVIQEQSLAMPGMGQLHHWLGRAIQKPELLTEQQRRLETDSNLIQIVTIHASKGLQYPIVYVPFLSRYRQSNHHFYHNEDYELCFSPSSSEAFALQSDKERIAEDIRLLYVAVTRSIYSCWLGIWNNRPQQTKTGSGFSLTALGHLLFGHIPKAQQSLISDEGILATLQRFASGPHFELNIFDYETELSCSAVAVESDERPELEALMLTTPVSQSWFLSSFSSISRNRISTSEHGHNADIKAFNETETGISRIEVVSVSEDQLPWRFTFQRGAVAGSFLHDVLEKSVDFSLESITKNAEMLATQYGIDTESISGASHWLHEVVSTPFSVNDSVKLSLSNIPANQRLPEMEFYLPLREVNVNRFNEIVSRYTNRPDVQYDVKQLNGMLKGYIDLVFVADGRYYVADYKSNHLGDSFEQYHPDELLHAMASHDYLLQALLYTLALHRFLALNLKNYSYDKHVGGALYFFLRGMKPDEGDSGVFKSRPDVELVIELDKLFEGTSCKKNLTQSEEVLP